ncbi:MULTISPECIES: SDR family NAD(P)-dependent oxidoreductase [unclassified Rhizobium]|uniref:SDR family NAD(P)-dependent oxidoreductase n=1 Tax=Rhizobium TaxID=379 RepID=UPI00084BCB9B|nr:MULTISPECIES: SDR family NAD(P)-dependent oxidoreductase [unclassified Rhizobium]OEC95946.1 short-chain dehydrogenase/reductase [Rhizobium sp. YK2]QYA16148.1 SDR family NAD(P)-dependent oxidoreductase [Rhizobium sp. AB2/73]UEQ84691.1 SDR family NAD(P)-dependent oxidoreductase [Rhizobium sp. AB2/73]
MAENKTWLITGSSRGLGRQIAESVLKAGGNVVATARDKAQLNTLVQQFGSKVKILSLDVTDTNAARHAAAEAVQTFGRLDVLVNNAGYADVASIEDMSEEMFRAQIDTNFYGVVNMTRASLPIMRAQGAGHIIQISSVGGRVGGAGLGAYQAAKWAVGGFSEVLAKEVASFGIKVTVAEPGGMRTNWAGSSMAVPSVSEAYKPVIEPAVQRLRDADGKQPGDPELIAKVLLDIAAMDVPPLRLLLGRDAVAVAKMAADNLAASDEKWRSVSESVVYAT